MFIRPLTTLEDCRQVVALEKEVWGYTDAEDVVPAPVLIVTIKRGGILLGAFDDGRCDERVRVLHARDQGRPTDAVVAHAGRDTSGRDQPDLGTRLKLAQREAALAMGLDLIEWTYDPLQALNAHLNFAKLGVVVEEYEENIYGESSSLLHRGTPTDRFVAEWHLTSPTSNAGSPTRPDPLMRDASVAAAAGREPLARGWGQWLAPVTGRPDLEDRRVLVEIPAGLRRCSRGAALALEWRMATRNFQPTSRAAIVPWTSFGARMPDAGSTCWRAARTSFSIVP